MQTNPAVEQRTSAAEGGLGLGKPVREFVAVIVYSSWLRMSGDLCGPSCCPIFTARIIEKATTPNRCTKMITVLKTSLYSAQQQFIAHTQLVLYRCPGLYLECSGWGSNGRAGGPLSSPPLP